jgi:S-adenosylhomocysteine hydrolase
VRDGCRLLGSIAAEFAKSRPFDGLTIGTGIHLEPKTVALLLTLAEGGARVVSTGNLSSTQADAVDYLRARGVDVIGGATTDEAEHDEHLRRVTATRPNFRNACASVAVVEIDPVSMGNSIESMDLGFALQARCLEAVAAGSLGGSYAVVPVPRFIDELVATSFLDLYGRSGTSPPGSVPPGSGPRPAGPDGAGGFADDQGTGQHLAGGRAPGPDIRA